MTTMSTTATIGSVTADPPGSIVRSDARRVTKENAVPISSATRTQLERERAVARDPNNANYIQPDIPAGAVMLDVGCGGGWDGQRDNVARFIGIDPDAESLAWRIETDPEDECYYGGGELLPFKDASFDFVMSRGGTPFMILPLFFAEAARVTKDGGQLWLMCHGIEHVILRDFKRSLVHGNVKDMIYRMYVLANGALFHLSRAQFRFPLNRQRMESFLTKRSLTRELSLHGFTNIQFRRTPKHFIATAIRTPRA